MNGEPGTQNGARIAGIRIQRTACAKFIEVRRKAPSGVRQHLKKRTQFAGVAGARACQPSSFHCFPDFLNRRSSSLSPERFEIWSAPLPDIAQTGRQLGFAVWTAATPITGAPAAYCFHIHTHRASRTARLSDPIRHRCDQVLTIGTYHASPEKAFRRKSESLVSAGRERVKIYFQKL